MKKSVLFYKNGQVKRGIKSRIVSLLICVGLFAVAFAIGFYILIISGLFPSITNQWVCTAWGTMHHRYLATWFFSQETIDEIIESERVDDTGFETDVEQIVIPENDVSEKDTETENDPLTEQEKEEEIEAPVIVDPYEEEGYTKLETGLYLKEVSGNGWQGFLMLIDDPKRVKVEDTRRQMVCGQKVSTMINNAGAVAGINGGGFTDGPNYDSNGGTPSGVVIENGVLVYPQDPELIENKTYNMVGMNSDGVLVLRQCTPSWAMQNDIVSAVSFSPYIIVNGKGLVREGTTGGWGIAPRTAIGQRQTGEIIFMVVDGRQPGYSSGCDLLPLQETLLAEKCHNAAMMDGGSSTVMIYNNEFINRPSLGFERYINNCWVVLHAEQDESENTQGEETASNESQN